MDLLRVEYIVFNSGLFRRGTARLALGGTGVGLARGRHYKASKAGLS